MRTFLTVILLLASGVGFVGCSTPKGPSIEVEPPFFAPSAAMTRKDANLRADDILPGSLAEALYAPRMEKALYGSMPVSRISAYTIYTSDSQAIHTPGSGSSGYRYRWLIQSGLDINP